MRKTDWTDGYYALSFTYLNMWSTQQNESDPQVLAFACFKVHIVKRYKQLGLSMADGNRAQNELLDLEYVYPVTIDGVKLLEPTGKGKIALGKMDIKIPADFGRGGLEHRFYLSKLKAKYIERGYFTYLEKDNIDLIAEKEDKTVAIQLETGKSNTRKNIISLHKYEADSKIMLATNKQAKLKAQEIAGNDSKNLKIEIYLVKDFLSGF